MTKYQTKPIEVEAWNVGSEEPMPFWLNGYFDGTLGTYTDLNGLTYSSNWWFIRSSNGVIKCLDNADFQQQYIPMTTNNICTVNWIANDWGVCECGGDIYASDIYCTQCGRKVNKKIMSDCSTQAFEHKERPRTCGTCISKCIYAGKDDTPACCYYKPDYDVLEQHYQQLAQVALDMLNQFRKYGSGEFCVVYQHDIDPFEEQLEALGVNVDG